MLVWAAVSVKRLAGSEYVAALAWLVIGGSDVALHGLLFALRKPTLYLPAGACNPKAHCMITQSTLKPGQRGTKQLADLYGDRLVCVRYRYDPRAGKRYKTVELIVEEGHWSPPSNRKPGQPVYVRVGYGEERLRERVKAAGARWDARRKLWKLPYVEVAALGLETRIVEPGGS